MKTEPRVHSGGNAGPLAQSGMAHSNKLLWLQVSLLTAKAGLCCALLMVNVNGLVVATRFEALFGDTAVSIAPHTTCLLAAAVVGGQSFWGIAAFVQLRNGAAHSPSAAATQAPAYVRSALAGALPLAALAIIHLVIMRETAALVATNLDTMARSYYADDKSPAEAAFIETVNDAQQFFACCGIINGTYENPFAYWLDTFRWYETDRTSVVIPWSCCRQLADVGRRTGAQHDCLLGTWFSASYKYIYTVDCGKAVSAWLQRWLTVPLAAISAAVCVLAAGGTLVGYMALAAMAGVEHAQPLPAEDDEAAAAAPPAPTTTPGDAKRPAKKQQ